MISRWSGAAATRCNLERPARYRKSFGRNTADGTIGGDILPLIEQSLHLKAKELGGQFTADIDKVNADDITNRSMITIGG